MKRPIERNDRRSARGEAGELQRALDRLRARVGEKHALRTRAWRESSQPLAQRGHRLVIEIGAADMEKARRGVHNCRDNGGMRVTGGRDGDSGHEVEVAIAVDILDHRAGAPGDDERILLDV